jgi:hypothetical protein
LPAAGDSFSSAVPPPLLENMPLKTLLRGISRVSYARLHAVLAAFTIQDTCMQLPTAQRLALPPLLLHMLLYD